MGRWKRLGDGGMGWDGMRGMGVQVHYLWTWRTRLMVFVDVFQQDIQQRGRNETGYAGRPASAQAKHTRHIIASLQLTFKHPMAC